MKTLNIAFALTFALTGVLQAKSMERMRAQAENINIDTSSLAKKTAPIPRASAGPVVSGRKQPAAAPEVKASTSPLIAAIVHFFRLLFGANGDIEIANPVAEVPEYEGELADDTEQETYVEGQVYEPLDSASLPAEPFQQQPQTPSFQQGQPRPAAGGPAVPEDLKRKALDYFYANSGKFANKRYIGVVDFAAHSSLDRFWILDLVDGTSHALHVAHGTGSDPDNDGYATRFSNVPNSRTSSLGFYLTGALYTGKHGRSMRLHGLSSTNSKALSRAVVLHDSDYVREGSYKAGRSFGCLAVANSEIANVLASLRGGALIYAGISNSEF
ncbi:MAG: murein L,D-transpeptidase catalytic domain family protein [Elusimicrobiales bacterium]|nr:murein L,D-transpeptidase catalytic domain family protein [Elusimicrobiales bacterium]